MKFDFERWPGNVPTEREQQEPYIRFGVGKSLFMNTKFCEILEEQDLHRFDIFVDEKARVIGLKFFRDEGGHYHIKIKPAQFGLSAFVNRYEPMLKKHIAMKYDEESGMWLGHLDGERVPEK